MTPRSLSPCRSMVVPLVRCDGPGSLEGPGVDKGRIVVRLDPPKSRNGSSSVGLL